MRLSGFLGPDLDEFDEHFRCLSRADTADVVFFDVAIDFKVFQISENTYAPGEHTIKRKHSFADLSTRKHYPGEHEIAIIVNGVEKASAMLMLRAF